MLLREVMCVAVYEGRTLYAKDDSAEARAALLRQAKAEHNRISEALSGREVRVGFVVIVDGPEEDELERRLLQEVGLWRRY